MEIDEARFETMVEDALELLPAPLAAALDNVMIIIRDGTPGGQLLGRYTGTPLTEREAYGLGPSMPDEVALYRRSITSVCSTEAEVIEQVRITVIHELAHHFGIDDDRLDALGWA